MDINYNNWSRFVLVRKQHQKLEPDYNTQKTFAYNYLHPTYKPKEYIKIASYFRIEKDIIIMSIDNKDIHFRIRNVIVEAFSKQYICFNPHSNIAIFTFYENNLRIEDSGISTDMLFSKSIPIKTRI